MAFQTAEEWLQQNKQSPTTSVQTAEEWLSFGKSEVPFIGGLAGNLFKKIEEVTPQPIKGPIKEFATGFMGEPGQAETGTLGGLGEAIAYSPVGALAVGSIKAPKAISKLIKPVSKIPAEFASKIGLGKKVKISSEVIKETGKQRKFLETVAESPTTVKQVKKGVEAIEPQTYEQITNEQSLFQAEKKLKKNGVDKMKEFVLSDTPPSAEKGAGFIKLIDKFQRDGYFDEAINLTENYDKQLREAGRFVQAASIWDRLSSPTMLRYAEKQIAKHAPKGAAEKAKVVVKTATESLQQETTRNLGTIIKEIQGRILKYVPEKQLAKRIQGIVTTGTGKPKEDQALRDMVNTLFKVAKESLPQKKIISKSPIEFIGQAIKQKAEYAGVWKKAKGIVYKKYANNPEVLKVLDDYFGAKLIRPFAKSQGKMALASEIKNQVIKIGQIVRQHYTKAEEVKSDLTEALITKAGVSQEEAGSLVRYINQRFNQLTSVKKQQILQSMFKEYPQVDKTLIEKIIEYSNLGAFSDKKYFGLVAKKLGIPSVDSELARYIFETMNKAQILPDGPEKTKLVSSVLQKIAEKVPLTIGEKFKAYRYTNMLSNLKTQEKNLIENIYNTFITRPWDLVTKGGIDWIQSGLSGKARQAYISDVPLYYKKVVNAIPNAFAAFKQVWKGEVDIAKPDIAIEQFRLKQLPGVLTAVPRFMEGVDKFLQTLIATGEFAVRKKAGASDDVARQAAETIAKKYLYRLEKAPKDAALTSRWLSSVGEALESVRRKVPGSDWFIPFIRTPINKAIEMTERTPLGLIGGKQDLETVAKALNGSIVMGVGATVAWQGNTTWGVPRDPKQRELFYASGKKPYSIKIGENWFPVWYLGPFAMAFALPAAAKYYAEDSPKALVDNQIDKLIDLSLASAKFISEQTSLQGLGGLFKMLENDEAFSLDRLAAFTLGQAIPAEGLVRYISQILDPVYRKPKGFVESLMKDIPFASRELAPYRTPIGEEATRESINAILPYDIGKIDEFYEPYYENRQQKLQINAIKNQMLKERESEIERNR